MLKKYLLSDHSGRTGVNLGGLYVSVTEKPADGFNGYAVRQKYGRGVRVACNVIGQMHLEAALSAYIFEYFVTTAVTRNGENMTVPCQSLVFLYDTLGNVQKTDV